MYNFVHLHVKHCLKINIFSVYDTVRVICNIVFKFFFILKNYCKGRLTPMFLLLQLLHVYTSVSSICLIPQLVYSDFFPTSIGLPTSMFASFHFSLFFFKYNFIILSRATISILSLLSLLCSSISFACFLFLCAFLFSLGLFLTYNHFHSFTSVFVRLVLYNIVFFVSLFR